MRPSVLIVDDHSGFRDAAKGLLEAEGFDVVGLAANGSEAVAETVRLRPDLVLLDVQLTDSDGFATAEMLARLKPPPIVVLTSSRSAAAYGTRLLQAPVRAFVAKSDLSGAVLASFL